MDWISILAAALAVATPLLFGALGEIFTQRAGIINLGLEGVMLVGAASSYIVAVNSGSLTVALLTCLLVGLVLGLLYALLTVTLQANQTVCGLAMVIFGEGLSGTIGKAYAGISTPVSFSKIEIPGLSDIPVLGDILFKQDILVYSLYILVPLAYIYIYKTRPGMKLRALGENPGALDAMGHKVSLMRYLYVMVGTAITALGGLYISLCYTPSWTDSITAGKGWIAAALVIFASWNPLMAAFGAVLFGLIQVVGLRLQLEEIAISSYFLNMLPYLFTIIVLILTTGGFIKKRAAGPAMVGKTYSREDR